MLTKKELQQRKKITEAEVHELIEGFDVLIMDICDACGVSKPTMDIYLGENTTPLPKKHQKTLIDFFKMKYKNGTPNKKNQEITDDVTKDTPENVAQNDEPEDTAVAEQEDIEDKDEEPETHDHIDKKFEHLSFERIVFRPKNGDLGAALVEALEYSNKAGIPVHVRQGNQHIKISSED